MSGVVFFRPNGTVTICTQAMDDDGNPVTHTSVNNEVVGDIAKNYDVPLAALLDLNWPERVNHNHFYVNSKSRLQAGIVLMIPAARN